MQTNLKYMYKCKSVLILIYGKKSLHHYMHQEKKS